MSAGGERVVVEVVGVCTGGAGTGEVDADGYGVVDACRVLRVNIRLAQRGRHRRQTEHRPIARRHRRVGLGQVVGSK